MTIRTITLDTSESGYSLYAKPEPLTDSPTWDDDAIDFTAEPFDGYYTFDNTLNDSVRYVVFRQVDESKSINDERVWTFDAVLTIPTLQGPYTRAITVLDDDNDEPIQLAKVRLYRTGESESKTANSSGVVTFTTEAATFNYAVTANGYSGASGTIAISADGSTTILLTANTILPAATGFCNLAFDVFSQSGDSAPITCKYELDKAFRLKSGTLNVNTDGPVTPDNDRIELELIQGAVYGIEIWQGNILKAEFRVNVPRQTSHLLTEAILI